MNFNNDQLNCVLKPSVLAQASSPSPYTLFRPMMLFCSYCIGCELINRNFRFYQKFYYYVFDLCFYYYFILKRKLGSVEKLQMWS